LVLEATLDEAVPFMQFATQLRRQGLLGGGSANPDGTLDLHHYFVRSMADMPFQVEIPGLLQRPADATPFLMNP
jgi:hypothetical protein